MSMLENLIASGRIVDIMLAVFVLEIAALRLFRGKQIRLLPLLANIGAGGSLMLALRAALTEAGWMWIAIWLVAALVFHVWDLSYRLRPAAQPTA
ncbi:MAG: hypothetical protein QNI99_03285 [Woeseiaceae bacterium]|nr:hypothetical protein [Woeseiaceae bacterium]